MPDLRKGMGYERRLSSDMYSEMKYPHTIEIRVKPHSRLRIKALKFSVSISGVDCRFAVHPTIPNGETLTISELSTGLALTKNLDIRLADFPEVVIPRCKDFIFETRARVGDDRILEVIENEVIKQAAAMDLDDDIPF